MAESCILVTGGTGYLGSHTVLQLVSDGWSVVVVDSLINSYKESIIRVEKIVGKTIPTYIVDLMDKEALQEVFSKHPIDTVIHFAGLKAVGASISKPFQYYQNNLTSTITLIEVMRDAGVKNLIFSSSATVYGVHDSLPLDEKHPTGSCTNPYARTKYTIEQILRDISEAEKDWNMVILRYFNPAGAHKSGRIGECGKGEIPENLWPYLSQVAVGRLPHLQVFGSDYDTRDGTPVRDYLHVEDLVVGHLAAVKKAQGGCGCKIYNLGTGKNYTVLEIVKAFEKACRKTIPYVLVDRRQGDLEWCCADPSLARTELNWTATKGLDQICEDQWRWQSNNPHGYRQCSNQ